MLYRHISVQVHPYCDRGVDSELRCFIGPLNSRECENLGFTRLALCSDCNTQSEYVKNKGIVNYGNPPFGGECCALIEGLVDLEAASCICIALKTNVLGMNLNIPINLSKGNQHTHIINIEEIKYDSSLQEHKQGGRRRSCNLISYSITEWNSNAEEY
ncbi:hypothetical protein RYX36_013333 [Vicia faba]